MTFLKLIYSLVFVSIEKRISNTRDSVARVQEPTFFEILQNRLYFGVVIGNFRLRRFSITFSIFMKAI